VPIQDLEAAAGLAVEIQQPDQHEQRPEQGVEKELDCGVDPVGAAPDADDDEHRDEGRLEEHVEQHRVQRREHSVQHPGEEQERGVVLRDAVFHHRPAGDDHQDGDEAVQQQEQHADAVDAQVIVDVEALDPGNQLDELHGAGRSVEPGVERDGDQKAQDRAAQRERALDGRIAIAAGKQDRHARQHRNPDREGQEHQGLRNQYVRSTTPISMVKAYW
jgi:hypothetical protein